MATLLKNKLLANIGATEALILTTDSTTRVTVIGLSLTNITDAMVLASVRILDTTTLDTAYYIKNVIIPPHQSLRVVNGGEKLVLSQGMSVYVQTNTELSIDLVMSYVELT
jgi:hypothetical protein